jgi:AcrR family transcriptional regulator
VTLSVDAITAINHAAPNQFQLRKIPKQQRSWQAFESILDAAVDIATEQGIACVNTNAIADYAGLDVATVYRNFPHKDAILYWAAARWLLRVRDTCTVMEQAHYQQLAWPEFFAEHGRLVEASLAHLKAYRPLQTLWSSGPAFEQLMDEHYAYLVNFYVRHFQRFGATQSPRQLKQLAYYLVLSSDLLRSINQRLDKEDLAAVLALDQRTWQLHLQAVLKAP